jgi:hypothetical protein
MGDTWRIAEEWADRLREAGLSDYADAMEFSGGRCVSFHQRGQVFRIPLADGQRVYLKRDVRISPKDLATDLAYFHLPQPPSEIERRALVRLAEAGIAAPQPIAWGQHRRGLLPGTGMLVMTELPGTALNVLLRDGLDGDARRAAMIAVGNTAARLLRARLYWPDMHAKHFYLQDDFRPETTGVLDVARMRFDRRPRGLYAPRQIRRFCDRLVKQYSGTADDIATFLNALKSV